MCLSDPSHSDSTTVAAAAAAAWSDFTPFLCKLVKYCCRICSTSKDHQSLIFDRLHVGRWRCIRWRRSARRATCYTCCTSTVTACHACWTSMASRALASKCAHLMRTRLPSVCHSCGMTQASSHSSGPLCQPGQVAHGTRALGAHSRYLAKNSWVEDLYIVIITTTINIIMTGVGELHTALLLNGRCAVVV